MFRTLGRFLAVVLSYWVGLHSWLRSHDVEEMPTWEILVGYILGVAVIAGLLFLLTSAIVTVIS